MNRFGAIELAATVQNGQKGNKDASATFYIPSRYVPLVWSPFVLKCVVERKVAGYDRERVCGVHT
jgi:hypothetical protein